MNKRALIACLSVVAILGGNNKVQGADETATLPTQVLAQNSQGDTKDLLMFFEEQDLVTATKHPTSLRKAPAIATIISADEIR